MTYEEAKARCEEAFREAQETGARDREAIERRVATMAAKDAELMRALHIVESRHQPKQ